MRIGLPPTEAGMVAAVQDHSGLRSLNPNHPSSVLIDLDGVRRSVGGDDRRRFAGNDDAYRIGKCWFHEFSPSSSSASSPFKARHTGFLSQPAASPRVTST